MKWVVFLVCRNLMVYISIIEFIWVCGCDLSSFLKIVGWGFVKVVDIDLVYCVWCMGVFGIREEVGVVWLYGCVIYIFYIISEVYWDL